MINPIRAVAAMRRSHAQDDRWTHNLDAQFLALLRCPQCGSLLQESSDGLLCERGAHHYDVAEGVPLLWSEGTRGSQLEDIDYDAVHAVNRNTIDVIGKDWAKLFGILKHDLGDVLEIGAGTGALTKGLINNCRFDSIVVTDISQKFLVPLHEQMKHRRRVKAKFVVYDTKDRIFADQSFDTIIGRSVLHHVLDYKGLLAAGTRLLRDGGRGIFFEPVLQGKALVSLLLGMALFAHEKGWQKVLNESDLAKLQRLLRHQTKSGWYPQDAESLSKIEDKYIFDIDQLIETGNSVGYKSVTYHELDETDKDYKKYFRHTLRVAGIESKKIDELQWVCDVFGETYGLVLPHQLKKPMGYFVFAM